MTAAAAQIFPCAFDGCSSSLILDTDQEANLRAKLARTPGPCGAVVLVNGWVGSIDLAAIGGWPRGSLALVCPRHRDRLGIQHVTPTRPPPKGPPN